jgi:hypothetical protein
MIAIRCAKLRMMAVSVRVPSTRGQGDEHVLCEEVVPRLLRDDADRHAVVGIRTGVAVLHEQLLTLEERLESRHEGIELVRCEGPVVFAPPDLVLRRLLLDHELVGRGSRRVRPSVHEERPTMGQVSLTAEDRFLVERRSRQVPEHAVQVHESVVLEPEVALQVRRLLERGRIELEVLRHDAFL